MFDRVALRLFLSLDVFPYARVYDSEIFQLCRRIRPRAEVNVIQRLDIACIPTRRRSTRLVNEVHFVSLDVQTSVFCVHNAVERTRNECVLCLYCQISFECVCHSLASLIKRKSRRTRRRRWSLRCRGGRHSMR